MHGMKQRVYTPSPRPMTLRISASVMLGRLGKRMRKGWVKEWLGCWGFGLLGVGAWVGGKGYRSRWWNL